MFPDDQIEDNAYAVYYGRAQPFDSCMQDQTAGYFTTRPINQSPAESWYGTTNPYPQPLYPEHLGCEEPSTPLAAADYVQPGGSMTTSSTAPSGYFDFHNTDWFPKPPSLCQECTVVSALAVQQQQQLDMQYEQVDRSSCHQPPHLSHCDYESLQLCDRVADTTIDASQHSLNPTYPVDGFRRFVRDQWLATSHPSHSIDPSHEEQLVYQRSMQDQTNPYAQEYECHASFDMAGSYTLSAATESIHQQPPAFNPSSSSLAGACPIISLPSLLLGPAPRQHINTEVYARSRDCIDYHQYSHADEAFAPASALAQETAAPMIVPSQRAAAPSHLAAAPAAFILSSRHRTWAKEGSGERGSAEQIGQSPLLASHAYVSPHETYYMPTAATLIALRASQYTFGNEPSLSIDPRHLQPLEHPCANSYDPHAPSIRNNPRARVKSPERIALEAADPTNEAVVKAVLSEHGRLQRKAHTRKVHVEQVRQQTSVTTAASEESLTGTLLIGLEDASSPPPPSPSAARKRTGKKPALACHFCRGRKIACGSSRSGEGNETCNQCTRRGLTCVYPTESRRGMHKKMVLTGPNPVAKIRARPKGKKNTKSSATVVPEFDRVELTPVPP